MLKAGTKACLHRIAEHHGKRSITDLIEWLAQQTDSDIAEQAERKTKDEIIRRAL